jgi:outer membrane protein assembly factor BamE
MSVSTFLHRASPWVAASLACVSLAACTSFNSTSNSIASIVTPYKVEVVQGNFVSKEQVDALRPGMSRAQVRELLGSPLVTSAFHADRWDYVFTIRRQGVEAQSRKLAVFFKGDELEKFEGDTMPSEAEFVSKLDSNRKLGKVPNLEASEADLAKAQGTPLAAPTSAPAPVVPLVYPPLEAPSR